MRTTTSNYKRTTTSNYKELEEVEAGKRLAAHNHRKREELKAQAQSGVKSRVNQYYGIGVVIAVGVIGGLGYYIYRTKQPSYAQPNNPPKQPSPQTDKFEMD